MPSYYSRIAKELSVHADQVKSTIQLLEDGGTVPFIARYRKELTGSLDEVQIAAVRDRLEQMKEVDKRREAIIKSIEEQDKLTDDLREKLENAESLTVLEDIYLPYKPKRKTRASIAREKGLEPLAERIFHQESFDVQKEAKLYLNADLGVETEEEALKGARDIIAEWINEDAEIREQIRRYFQHKATIKSRVFAGKEAEAQKYKDYFEWEEELSKAPSHRVLAMRRGEAELFLMLDLLPPAEGAIELLERAFIETENEAAEQLRLAVKDGYKRLLRPSMETELRALSKQKADEEAISVFSKNLEKLLMAAPLGQKAVIAIDPGFRTGCKMVCLDKQGKLLAHTAIFPNEPQKDVAGSRKQILTWVEKYDVQAIAIGNGTAGRETESFVKAIGLPSSIAVVMVNESGASIYSASEIAREEFGELDLTVRGAVSIGRRLMDPLAELVKLDPKSIGVGQYQHDVDQSALKHSLDDVVMRCVNAVGVEINTASEQLLTYVAGLGPKLAKNVVEYRNEHGAFKSRSEVKKVSRLGEKAFEQAAGFLRIRDAKNPLDNSAVHPEAYAIVQKMAKDLNCKIQDLIINDELRKKIKLSNYVSDNIGMPTLKDIMVELAKPGRDPREQFEVFSFAEGVNKPEDLKIGMKLPGLVTNVTNFGAFVDIGVHQDGLVHISQLADRFVKNPEDVVSVQQQVMVTVTEVDLGRKRIALSMKKDPFSDSSSSRDKGSNPANARKKENSEQDMKAKLEALKRKFGK